MTNEFELKARRAKMEQVFARQAQDAARTAFLVTKNEQRRAHAVPGLEILDRFYRSGDVHALRDELQKWSQAPAFQAFGGVAGQMFLNQLVKSSPDTTELSRLLARCRCSSVSRSAGSARDV